MTDLLHDSHAVNPSFPPVSQIRIRSLDRRLRLLAVLWRYSGQIALMLAGLHGLHGRNILWQEKKFLFGRKVVRLKPDHPDRRLRPCIVHYSFSSSDVSHRALKGAVRPFGRCLGWRRCTASQLVNSCHIFAFSFYCLLLHVLLFLGLQCLWFFFYSHIVKHLCPLFVGGAIEIAVDWLIAQCWPKAEAEALVWACELLGETEGLIEAVGFKKTTESMWWRTSVNANWEWFPYWRNKKFCSSSSYFVLSVFYYMLPICPCALTAVVIFCYFVWLW